MSGIRSRCGLTAANASEPDHTPEDDIDNEDLDDWDESDTDNSNELAEIATPKGKSVLESHPYIISQWVTSQIIG